MFNNHELTNKNYALNERIAILLKEVETLREQCNVANETKDKLQLSVNQQTVCNLILARVQNLSLFCDGFQQLFDVERQVLKGEISQLSSADSYQEKYNNAIHQLTAAQMHITSLEQSRQTEHETIQRNEACIAELQCKVQSMTTSQDTLDVLKTQVALLRFFSKLNSHFKLNFVAGLVQRRLWGRTALQEQDWGRAGPDSRRLAAHSEAQPAAGWGDGAIAAHQFCACGSWGLCRTICSPTTATGTAGKLLKVKFSILQTWRFEIEVMLLLGTCRVCWGCTCARCVRSGFAAWGCSKIMLSTA